MDEKLEFLKELFNLKDKDVEWGVVVETTRKDGEEESMRKPGLFVKGSRVFVDLYARRFYSRIDKPEIKREIHPAKLLKEGEGLTIIRDDEEESENTIQSDKMAVLIAKDDDRMDLMLTERFVDRIFSNTVYGPWMENALIL